MRGARVYVVTLVMATSLAAWGQRGSDARAAIERGGKQWSEGVERGDAPAIAQLYAEDAQAFPPNAELVSGRANIQKLWQSFLTAGVKKAALESMDVESAGNIAYETGKWRSWGADGKEIDHGKYVVVWKRVNGQWKMYRDIWNSDTAAK